MMPFLAVMNAIKSAMASSPARNDASPTPIQAMSAASFRAATWRKCSRSVHNRTHARAAGQNQPRRRQRMRRPLRALPQRRPARAVPTNAAASSLEDAIIIARVEMFEQTHVRHCVERRAPGQYEPVAAGRADQTVNDVDEGILEHHLGGGRLVEPFLRIWLVTNVLDTQDRIGVPHVLGRYGRAQDADELRRVGPAKKFRGQFASARLR